MSTFLFVGERPSAKAVKIGATWQNGKLAGKTLHDALKANNIEPTDCTFLNLWYGSEPSDTDESSEQVNVDMIRLLQERGDIVIALGNLVSRTLTRYGVAHLKMVHPAARGSIRKTERYQAHVGAVLTAGRTAK